MAEPGVAPQTTIEDEDENEGPMAHRLRAIENARQSAAVLAFVLKGLANGGESFSQREDIRRDQEVRIIGSDRMPIDAVCGDRHFRNEIGARDCETFDGKTAERNATDHPVLLTDLARIEESLKLFSLFVGRNRCRQSSPEPFRAGEVDCF